MQANKYLAALMALLARPEMPIAQPPPRPVPAPAVDVNMGYRPSVG